MISLSIEVPDGAGKTRQKVVDISFDPRLIMIVALTMQNENRQLLASILQNGIPPDLPKNETQESIVAQVTGTYNMLTSVMEMTKEFLGDDILNAGSSPFGSMREMIKSQMDRTVH